MMLPLYVIFSDVHPIDIDCYTSDQVQRELRKLAEKDSFRRIPSDVRIYLWRSWIDITKDFITGV